MLKRSFSYEKKITFIVVAIFFIMALYHFFTRRFFELITWLGAIFIILYYYYKNKREKEDYEKAKHEWEQMAFEQRILIKKMETMMENAEKLGIIGELAAGIAHEVRNPLTTLKGFLQLMNLEVDAAKKSYVDLMLTEVDRIDMITDEFMSIARPHEQHFKRENIVYLMEHVISFLHPQAQLKNVQVLLRTNGEIPFLYCDGNQLKQVFINIMKNAFEAMPKGGYLYIMISCEDTNFFKIEFTDEGIGMPEEVLAKLGQPFYTLKESGHGLGIMMCKRIIDAHNGTMKIKSNLQEGTTFTIYLPIKEK